MILEKLSLRSFRIYDEYQFQPEPGLNIITGPNGSGKTALLEAVHILSAARSFRAKREQEVVKWGESSCRIAGSFRTTRKRERNLSMSWNREEGLWVKCATFQGDRVIRLADFLGYVPCSLFTPSDVDLISGTPAVRRRYLDLQLSKMMPAHLFALAQLRKVLAQRNALLRQGRPLNELMPWNKLLYDLSLEVGGRREELTKQLAKLCEDLHQSLVGVDEEVSLRYKRSWPDDFEQFQEKQKELYDKERLQATTLLSPQKDELDIQLKGRPLRVYGSQGQQRTFALCLRLAEAMALSAKLNEGAILLLDDVFSELDKSRSERLVNILAKFSQVLITTASSGQEYLSNTAILKLKR